MNLNGHMGTPCIRDGLTHNIGFQLLLLAFDICNVPIACTCHMHLMSLWGQTSRAVFACLGFIWVVNPLCLCWISPPPHAYFSSVKQEVKCRYKGWRMDMN